MCAGKVTTSNTKEISCFSEASPRATGAQTLEFNLESRLHPPRHGGPEFKGANFAPLKGDLFEPPVASAGAAPPCSVLATEPALVGEMLERPSLSSPPLRLL